MAVFQFIEGWYNPGRRHSALSYRSPINYERSTRELLRVCKPITVHETGGTPTTEILLAIRLLQAAHENRHLHLKNFNLVHAVSNMLADVLDLQQICERLGPLNDNNMSIAPPVGAMAYLTRFSSEQVYRSLAPALSKDS